MIKSLNDLARAFEALEIPFAYYEFNTGNGEPAPPYIAYYVTGSENFGADNIAFAENTKIIIEFYSEMKDLDNELKIKRMLSENMLFYQTSETFLENEGLHITYFTISIIS